MIYLLYAATHWLAAVLYLALTRQPWDEVDYVTAMFCGFFGPIYLAIISVVYAANFLRKWRFQ